MRTVFLDFDGVLNSEKSSEYFEPDKISLLNKLLASTDARLVITSTWRYGLSCSELDQILSTNGVLSGRVVGTTPYMDDCRGREIFEWLKRFGGRYSISEFVILDDRWDMWPLAQWLIRTSKKRGMTVADVELAISLLTSTTEDRSRLTKSPSLARLLV